MAIGPGSFEDTLKNTNIMLRMMGIPPCGEPYPDTAMALLRSNVGFIGSFLLLVYTTLGEVIYLVQMLQGSEVNFLEVTFQTPCIGYCLIGVLKMILLAVRRNTIAELVQLFRTKWKKAIISNENWTVCEETMRPAIRVTSVTALANVVMGIAFTMLPIAEMLYHWLHSGSWVRQLAFNIWWPFDVFAGTQYFWFSYPLYVIIGFNGIIIHMAFDCLFCILAAHLCLHFRILKLNIENVADECEEARAANERRLQDAIVQHQDLIGCSAFLQDVFGVVLFLNLLGSSIIICIQAFMITTVSGYTLIKFVLFMLCFLIELLMLCAYGEDIVQSSGAVADATYNCKWYEESRLFKTSILQILHTAQKPIVVTAWKIWPVQMVTFRGILQASWSYFTLLKTVYADN
ncbi:odorant receptor 4-like [Anopheles ziemanni]|uniref:odorant receptor 4-like n=1 Tax=Anopheles coustani TaxID=139045 RepID=UPI0026583C98|nr:odorant receptor 4-like [Anopheles coustani]XP_058178147.1 odorant receptor 4-like [Anopheles ziemanni]